MAVPPLNVVPLAAPAPPLLNVAAATVFTLTLADPLNDTPLMVRAVSSTVAVAALPVMSIAHVPDAPDNGRCGMQHR